MSSWKRIGELRNEDFQDFPVWLHEYRLVPSDSEDFDSCGNGEKHQGFVLPVVELPNLASNTAATYLVKSRFTLADGSEHFGFSSPCDGGSLDYSQPVLITASDHIQFWNDSLPKMSEPEESCRKLQKKVDEVFPVHCVALLPCDGEYHEWILEKIHVPAE